MPIVLLDLSCSFSAEDSAASATDMPPSCSCRSERERRHRPALLTAPPACVTNAARRGRLGLRGARLERERRAEHAADSDHILHHGAAGGHELCSCTTSVCSTRSGSTRRTRVWRTYCWSNSESRK